jgi:hypothetical protein
MSQLPRWRKLPSLNQPRSTQTLALKWDCLYAASLASCLLS